MEQNVSSSCGYVNVVTCSTSSISSTGFASRDHVLRNPIVPITFPQSQNKHSPCLPVSKGSIKKPAETRFVNSSPRSYRLMPASVESSDTTSFVEKSSQPNHYPMKVMLEVAELWKLSKRSELECNFTLAKSQLLPDTDRYIKEAMKRSPICHPSILPSYVHKEERRKWDCSEVSAKMGTGGKLFTFAQIFFRSQEHKDRNPVDAAEILKQELDSGVILTMNFLEKMRNHCVKDDSKSIEDVKEGNISLAPLVKRLSVSGIGDKKDHGKKCKDIQNINRPQTSIKRPSSSHSLDCDEAPVNKRALSNSALK